MESEGLSNFLWVPPVWRKLITSPTHRFISYMFTMWYCSSFTLRNRERTFNVLTLLQERKWAETKSLISLVMVNADSLLSAHFPKLVLECIAVIDVIHLGVMKFWRKSKITGSKDRQGWVLGYARLYRESLCLVPFEWSLEWSKETNHVADIFK